MHFATTQELFPIWWMSFCARSRIRMWRRGNKRWGDAHRNEEEFWTMDYVPQLHPLPPSSEIFLLISTSFGCCPKQWCGKPGSMKIQTCLCAVATNVPLSRHVHIDLQSKLIFFHQGFCILIYVKALKNNQFRIILLRRIFYHILSFYTQARNRFICMGGLKV